MTVCLPVFSEVSTRSQQLVQREPGGHLGGGVLAGAHGGQTHRRVILPGRGGDHQIDVVALAQAQEIGLAAVVERGRGLARLLDPTLGAMQELRVGIADGLHLDAVHAEADVQVVGAAIADAHEAEPDGANVALRYGSLQ